MNQPSVELRQIVEYFAYEDAALPIFPRSPLLTSRQTAWNSIYLEHHHQPVNATPEYRYGRHVVSVHIGRPALVEQWTGDRFEKGVVRNGDVAIYPAHVCYRERYYADSEFIDLHLEPNLLARTAEELKGTNQIELVSLFATRDPLIEHIGLALKAELELAGDRLYAESMANALAVHLLRRYSAQAFPVSDCTSGLSAHKLRQVLEYINEHLEQDLSLVAIAAVGRISPYHFSRLFKQSTGLSPHQYVIQCRVDRAKQLLLSGMAIADVAHQVGFAHQSHFTRQFKRLLGVTPKAFLNQ